MRKQTGYRDALKVMIELRSTSRGIRDCRGVALLFIITNLVWKERTSAPRSN